MDQNDPHPADATRRDAGEAPPVDGAATSRLSPLAFAALVAGAELADGLAQGALLDDGTDGGYPDRADFIRDCLPKAFGERYDQGFFDMFEPVMKSMWETVRDSGGADLEFASVAQEVAFQIVVEYALLAATGWLRIEGLGVAQREAVGREIDDYFGRCSREAGLDALFDLPADAKPDPEDLGHLDLARWFEPRTPATAPDGLA